ncbi:MAG: hypothetical protein K0R73_731 [Candidatus Midichloriaceae bacterium]|jgi:uncharacterized protein (UPF0335 family)|nr:hypothetical protein [Candidatus Midichloriaceae bacterium]
MTQVFGVAGDLLKQYISKIERLEQEKTDVLTTIRETYADMKSSGLEPKIIRRILKERKMDKNELDEEETLLVMYKRALGMLPELDGE